MFFIPFLCLLFSADLLIYPTTRTVKPASSTGAFQTDGGRCISYGHFSRATEPQQTSLLYSLEFYLFGSALLTLLKTSSHSGLIPPVSVRIGVSMIALTVMAMEYAAHIFFLALSEYFS